MALDKIKWLLFGLLLGPPLGLLLPYSSGYQRGSSFVEKSNDKDKIMSVKINERWIGAFRLCRERLPQPEYEGLRLAQYLVNGRPHIGVGHLQDKKLIDREYAFQLFEIDLSQAIVDITVLFADTSGISDERLYVLISMAFMLGRSGLWDFRDFCEAVYDRDWPKAAAELRDSDIYRERPSRGELMARSLEDG